MVELILIGGLALSLVVDLVLNKREYVRREKLEAEQVKNLNNVVENVNSQLSSYSKYLEEQRVLSEKEAEESSKKIDDSLLAAGLQVENVLSNFVEKLEEKDKKTLQFMIDVVNFMEEVEDLAETAEQIAQLQMFSNQPALQELKTQTVYLAKRAKAMRKEIESTGATNEE